MDRNHIALFCGLALAVCWTLQILALSLFGLNGVPTQVIFVAAMWTPTLIALGFIGLHRPARVGVLWRIGNPLYLPVGITVEALIGFGVVGALVALGLAYSGWFNFDQTGVAISGGPWLLGRGVQVWPLFLANVALTAAAYSTMGLVGATGEEFAWRGFLQGHLIRQFGVRRGIALVALVWWFWHLPAVVCGFDFPHNPLLGAFVLFPIQMLGASFFFGWLTLKSRSFWPAALAHAAVNSVQEGVISNLHLSVPQLDEDILRTALIAAVGLTCWIFLRPPARSSRHSQREFPEPTPNSAGVETGASPSRR